MGSGFDLGVGGIRIADPEDESPGWIPDVEFPLYPSPGGEPVGWVAGGWWVPPERGSEPVPLPVAAMVETGYESASWIALEARDGMARILLTLEPGPGGDGSAWVSLCHLAASDPPLQMVPWEAVLAGPLFYRNPSVRHALRAGPGLDRPLVDWLAGDDHDVMLEPLEIRGDWMRVRVSRPSTWCVDPPPDARVDDGWIRWRDDAMGPWVWWFTRGC